MSEAAPQSHEGYKDRVSSVTNGTQLASASEDRTLRLWDATAGNCLQSIGMFHVPDNRRISKACEMLSQAAMWTVRLLQDLLFCALLGARALEVVLVSCGPVEPPLEPGKFRIRSCRVKQFF